MRLLPGLYLFSIIFLSFYGVESRVVKREVNDNNNNDDDDASENKPPGTGGPQTSDLQKLLQGLIEISEEVPIIGGFLKNILQKLVFAIIQLELITNGVVARILGGALPCEISLSHGIRCSGISHNGGVSQILINAIDLLPKLLVPKFPKKVLKFIIKGVLNPIIDILFGGQQEFSPA